MKHLEIFKILSGLIAGITESSSHTGRDFTGVPSAAAEAPTAPAPVNLLEYEPAARERLSQMAYDYIAGGAGDEITLRRNRECFDQILLKPRVLVDVSKIDTRLDLFGQHLDFPILLAPCAYHKVVHPEGEIEAFQGAAAAGATLAISTFSTVAIEDIAQSARGRLWFQLYVQRDRGFTRDMIQRVEAAGCQALMITVDTPILGMRDREKRNRFQLPPGMERENLKKLGRQATRAEHFKDSAMYTILDPSLDWDTVDWICSFTRVPVVLKGILSPEDARRAAERGVAGLLVSNHGARNLDTVPSTIEALPAVVEAVQGRVPILLDGGVRRGTDIVKALAIGAKAVLIGRPYLWGLATAGAAGVQRVVEILRAELEATMTLCGTTSLSQIDRGVLWPRPTVPGA